MLAALAVGFAVAIGALASYILVHHELISQVDDSLTSSYNDITHVGPNGGFVVHFSRSVSSENIVWLIYPDGTPALETGSPPGSLPVSANVKVLALDSDQGDQTKATVTIGGTTFRMLAISLGPTLLSDGTPQGSGTLTSAALVIAHPLTDINRTLADLRLILLLVGLSGVAVAMGLGYGAARAMIRPVGRLTATAEHVAVTQDLGARIPEEGDDELGRLARSFNAMLGALESSRQQQAQLVADAGHELRTPLTSLRTNIEVLMRTPDLPNADRDELLGDVRAQLEELTTLVGDLVDMARDDEQLAEPVAVRLDEIVERAVERARRRATTLNFVVHLDQGSVRAQPALLERAVLNVLDNAAKWSPPGGQVEVTLRRGATWVLEVRDHGPGIAPEDLPRVFDRFYRAPTARSMPGSGLGLAIVRHAVQSHGGSVSVQLPAGGGTLLHIELPVLTPPLAWPPPPPPGPSVDPLGTPSWSERGTPPAAHVPSGPER